MDRTHLALLLSLLLLSQPLVEARRGGASITRGGGGSAARGGAFQPNTGGNFNRPNNFQQPHNTFQQPGQQPHWNQGGSRGFSAGGAGMSHNQPHFNSQPRFTSGNSFGSPSRASTFKHALAGAALGTIGGMLAFEAGKAIIRSATTPFNYEGRNYYFDRQNYQGNQANMCSMPLNQLISQSTPPASVAPPVTDANGTVTTTMSPQQVLQNIQYQDGSRPKEVVWSCPAGQVCCGTECCPAQTFAQNSPNAGGSHKTGSSIAAVVLGILLVLLILSCCCCFLIYKFCRETIECILPKRHEDNYYDDGTKYDGPSGQQSFPMGPYPPQPQQQYPPPPQYPPQSGYYPPAPQNSAGYPQYPHHQQF